MVSSFVIWQLIQSNSLVQTSFAADSVFADPTMPDTGIRHKNGEASNENGIGDLQLQQTIIYEKRKVAVINGESLTVGGTIRGARLMKIDQSKVDLWYQGKLFTLNLTDPAKIREVRR